MLKHLCNTVKGIRTTEIFSSQTIKVYDHPTLSWHSEGIGNRYVQELRFIGSPKFNSGLVGRADPVVDDGGGGGERVGDKVEVERGLVPSQ